MRKTRRRLVRTVTVLGPVSVIIKALIDLIITFHKH